MNLGLRRWPKVLKFHIQSPEIAVSFYFEFILGKISRSEGFSEFDVGCFGRLGDRFLRLDDASCCKIKVGLFDRIRTKIGLVLTYPCSTSRRLVLLYYRRFWSALQSQALSLLSTLLYFFSFNFLISN